MSKEKTINQHLMRSPKAFAEYQRTGRLPEVVTPTSPLIAYLESLGPAKRIQLKNVRLSPKLGYQSNMQFRNAELMLRYLKPANFTTGTWPARGLMIAAFNHKITDELFFAAQN